jgi:hypothetical protein
MEELLEVYPNEMLAHFWADVLRQEGIKSMVKPQNAGYSAWGRDSFIPHALLVLSGNIVQAKEIIKEADSP